MVTYLSKPLKDDGTYEKDSYWSYSNVERSAPTLIQVVKKLKKKANGMCADLKIITIPDDVDFEIHEYDGVEWVAEKHTAWS